MATQQRAVIIASANRKGGVGKTTGSAILGTMLRLLGCRVLTIDNDPQANLTSILGYTGYTGVNFYDVIREKANLRDCLLETAINEDRQYYNPRRSNGQVAQPGPYLAPITSEAEGADFDLKSKFPLWIYQTREALQPVLSSFDYVLIDCAPSLGTLTANALAAADFVLIPILPERLVVEGFSDLISAVAEARKKVNPSLQVAGVWLNMVRPWNTHRDIIDALHQPQWQRNMVQVLGEGVSPLRVFTTEIKHNAALATATNDRSLLVLDSPNSDYTKAYWFLLEEILEVVGGVGQAKARQVAANIRAGK